MYDLRLKLPVVLMPLSLMEMGHSARLLPSMLNESGARPPHVCATAFTGYVYPSGIHMQGCHKSTCMLPQDPTPALYQRLQPNSQATANEPLYKPSALYRSTYLSTYLYTLSIHLMHPYLCLYIMHDLFIHPSIHASIHLYVHTEYDIFMYIRCFTHVRVSSYAWILSLSIANINPPRSSNVNMESGKSAYQTTFL